MEESTAVPVILGLDAPDAGEALASFGIATAVRDAAISVGIVLGLLYVFPVLGLVSSSPGWGRQLQHTSPMTAVLLAVWAAAGLLVGGLLLRFRDP
jgi:ABC-2 type transport system permease protein